MRSNDNSILLDYIYRSPSGCDFFLCIILSVLRQIIDMNKHDEKAKVGEGLTDVTEREQLTVCKRREKNDIGR